MPPPRRHGGEGAEGLQARDVYAKGEVAVADLQRRRAGAGIAVRVAGLHDLAPVNFAGRADAEREMQQPQETVPHNRTWAGRGGRARAKSHYQIRRAPLRYLLK